MANQPAAAAAADAERTTASAPAEQQADKIHSDDESESATGAPPAAPLPALVPLKRHPLEHRWTLWFDNPQQRGKGGGWGTSLRSMHTFGTVEDFWCLYNNVLPPSHLVNKADMQLFKEGVQPKWEDPACEKGGSWTVACGRSKELFDRVWLNLLLAMIGGQFTHDDDVCGGVVNVRSGGKDRVVLWTRNAANEESQMSIGRQLKSFLDVSDKIGFSAFSDQKSSRNAHDRYTV